VTDDEVKDDVLDFLHRLHIDAQEEERQSAVGWVFLSYDEKPGDDPLGSPTVFGPFLTEMEATEQAQTHYEGVNLGAEPGDGWLTRVLPILPWKSA
jgi:hypothetical protein